MKIEKLKRPIRILLMTNGLILIAGAMLGPIYALFVEEIGGDLLDTSLAFVVYALVAGTTSLISGKYTDKMKENELIVVFGYGLMGIGFLGYTMVNSMITLLVIQFVIGIGEAIYSPAFDALFSKHLDKNELGSNWSVWEAMYYYTSAIGALIGGILVASFGFNIIFVIMFLICFASALYILLLPRKTL